MSASSSIAELLGSPQVVVGFGATTLVLLATTFFYLKNNEGSSDGGAASTSSALEKVEELDSEVRGVAAFFHISLQSRKLHFVHEICAHFILFYFYHV